MQRFFTVVQHHSHIYPQYDILVYAICGNLGKLQEIQKLHYLILYGSPEPLPPSAAQKKPFNLVSSPVPLSLTLALVLIPSCRFLIESPSQLGWCASSVDEYGCHSHAFCHKETQSLVLYHPLPPPLTNFLFVSRNRGKEKANPPSSDEPSHLIWLC